MFSGEKKGTQENNLFPEGVPQENLHNLNQR